MKGMIVDIVRRQGQNVEKGDPILEGLGLFLEIGCFPLRALSIGEYPVGDGLEPIDSDLDSLFT
jgi:hypothetical protein